MCWSRLSPSLTLSYRCSVDAKTRAGVTGLHIAVINTNIEAFELLIARGSQARTAAPKQNIVGLASSTLASTPRWHYPGHPSLEFNDHDELAATKPPPPRSLRKSPKHLKDLFSAPLPNAVLPTGLARQDTPM